MKTWIKGSLAGLMVWILLIIVLGMSGVLFGCALPTNEIGATLDGISCWNSIPNFIIGIFLIMSFPFFLMGANPNISTAGPLGVVFFWTGSMISFVLWGMLISWIVGKINPKK